MSSQNQINYKLTEFAAETMVYFEKHKLIEIAKKVLIECAIERPREVQQWIATNLKRIANEIYHDCINQGKYGIVRSLNLSANFLYRIVIFGRQGSGRKTQAMNLVSHFNLVFLDAEVLISQHLRGNDDQPFDVLNRELQRAFYYDNCEAKAKALISIIARRLLEKDCLQQGWILINFLNTLQDFKDLLENFKIPPNKLVYLKCDQISCMRRLLTMPSMDDKPRHSCTYYETEMRFFNKQEDEINNYLLKRHESVYVDASKSSDKVKIELMSRIIKSPYVMGFKQNMN